MSERPVFIRTATRRDLSAIRNLLVKTWHATYDDIFGSEVVTKITDKWHSIEALEAKLAAPLSEFIVADDGKSIHAMAFASQNEKTVELHQLYVLPASQGKGIGTELMQELFFCFDGADTMKLDVHPHNTNAVGFYRSGGFSEIGKCDVAGPDGIVIPHVILARKLDM